ncbi:hypothetical protein Tco_0822368 [Tanacetum coccineum]|uniref:Reverse transcriptase domain-containing protein n=1 Tax=Tanacetum coccineum TaxID=301880 RepID=A0ABQ5AJC7_9ASTR
MATIERGRMVTLAPSWVLEETKDALMKHGEHALDSAAGGNFLDKMPQEGLALMKECQNVRYSEVVLMIQELLSCTSQAVEDVCALWIITIFNLCPLTRSGNGFSVFNETIQQFQQTAAVDFENYVKANDAVLKNVQNQGQNLQNQMANVTSLLTSLCNNFKNSASTSNPGTLPSQTVTNPRQQINAITTRSGKTLEEPSIPLVPTPDISIHSKEPEQNPETSMEKVQNPNLENTAQVPSPGEEDSIFIEVPKAKKTVNLDPNPNSYQSKLPYPERMKVRENDKPSAQHSRFLKMFKQLRLEIGLKDAFVEMPKFNKWLSSLLRNKEKLKEIAITTVNAEFDPRVHIDTRHLSLRTAHALIDVYEGEITLRNDDQSLTLKCGDAPSISYNNLESLKKVDLIDVTCEEYSQEVLGFSDSVAYNNPSPYFDPIVSTSSPTLTPFDESDFLLFEEADAFIAIDDEPVSPVFNATYYDPEGDILILEALLNNDPLPQPNQGDYLPGIQKDLKVVEPKKSSVEYATSYEPKVEIPEVELKELPPHLEYAFLEENNKLPVIISKDLSKKKRPSLINVFENRKNAIA